MAQEKTRHHFNLALFKSYLSDMRMGTGIAFLAMIMVAVLNYQTADITHLTGWLLMVLLIDLVKLLSAKFFNMQMNEMQLARFEKWHFVNQTLLGLAWGSSCFLLMPEHDLGLNQLLSINILTVAIAYSVSIRSVSLTALYAFVTPFILCLLIYFGMDFAKYYWWFAVSLVLGISCILFGRLNHQHALLTIENQMQNKRYINELTKLKASMQKANMELVVKNETLISTQNRLEMLATNDELTQVFNRRYAMTYLDKMFAELNRRPSPFVLVLADIDHFKNINDRYGHPAGDEVLRIFSSAIKQQLREVDTVARFGGEEFLIMLPNTKELEAKVIIQRLCDTIAALNIVYDKQAIKVTSSFGLAFYKAGDSVEKLVERSDVALYHAKKSGRNNIKTFDEAEIAAFMTKP
ncbi:MAG: GGDEF domain-containing protein [Methylophilaceae bacterium]